MGSSQRAPAPTNRGTKRLCGVGCSAQSCRKGQAGALWAEKQLVMRNKTSKAHHGTSLAQILFRSSPWCSPFSFVQCQTQLLPLSGP